MKKLAAALTLALTVITLCITPALAKQVSGDSDSISITPSVIRLDADDATITVQTNVKYADTVPSTALLNYNVAPYLVKANSRGYLVAKFNLNDIRKYLTSSTSTLYFTVDYATATKVSPFAAYQLVTVVTSNQKPDPSQSTTYTPPTTTYTYTQPTYTYPSTSYTTPQTTYTYPSTNYTAPTYVTPSNPYVYSYNPYYP